MKVVSIVPDIHSTAVEHVGKHFDLVLGVDIHWTKLPFPPFPLPLPHPFIGFIFDPMEYVHFEICVPGILQQLLKLPAKLPMGASVYVHGRIKATATGLIPSGVVTALVASPAMPPPDSGCCISPTTLTTFLLN